MSLIKGEDLVLGYEKAVCSPFSFEIERGDYVAILGENGAGKSTLMKCLLGLHGALSGTLTFDPSIKKGDIGYLPQVSQIQTDFPASVNEVVLSGAITGLHHRFFYNKKDREMAEKNMERMGILPLRHKSFQELSGGQRQRVLLARAITACGNILVLDEPGNGLDSHTSSGLYELIEKLNREDGVTIIMVTHDIHPAINSATHVLYIGDNGFFGKKDDFFSSPCGESLLKETCRSHV